MLTTTPLITPHSLLSALCLCEFMCCEFQHSMLTGEDGFCYRGLLFWAHYYTLGNAFVKGSMKYAFIFYVGQISHISSSYCLVKLGTANGYTSHCGNSQRIEMASETYADLCIACFIFLTWKSHIPLDSHISFLTFLLFQYGLCMNFAGWTNFN